MRPPINAVRWILVIPAAIAGWYLAFILGMLSVVALDALCPPEMMISGACMASWYPPAVDLLIIISTGLSAVLAIVGAYMVTPEAQRKMAIAYTTYSVGALTAGLWAFELNSWAEFSCAVALGLMAILFLKQRASYVAAS